MAEDEATTLVILQTHWPPSPLLSLQLPPSRSPAPRAARPKCGHMGQGLFQLQSEARGPPTPAPSLGCWTAQGTLPITPPLEQES